MRRFRIACTLLFLGILVSDYWKGPLIQYQIKLPLFAHQACFENMKYWRLFCLKETILIVRFFKGFFFLQMANVKLPYSRCLVFRQFLLMVICQAANLTTNQSTGPSKKYICIQDFNEISLSLRKPSAKPNWSPCHVPSLFCPDPKCVVSPWNII